MDGGSFDLQIACTSTEYIVESAIQSVVPLAEAVDVTLQRFVSHAMLEVDPDRIIQVLINLLSNAVKFSPPESVIRCICSITEYGAEFIVSDSGTGIPDGFRERIFRKFECGDYDSSGSNSSGSGLGLHICKMIVEQHGGRIEYTSSSDGTTFVVKLPLKRSMAA
jgi:signal transduction histidine kinase